MSGPDSASGSLIEAPPAAFGEARLTSLSGWTLHEHQRVTSTNLVAAKLPAWHAVRSDEQTAGRGRFQRVWVSDAGGLWLSAVIPLHAPARALYPLGMGYTVARALQSVGVQGLRLRWPNDVLVGNRKLAGLLIDQFQAQALVVGIGINVDNRPEQVDPRLADCVVRLRDLVPGLTGLRQLTGLLLENIRQVAGDLVCGRFATVRLDEAGLWGGPRGVRLELDSDACSGIFLGVDAEGRLRLGQADGTERLFAAQQVRHLTELEPDHP